MSRVNVNEIPTHRAQWELFWGILLSTGTKSTAKGPFKPSAAPAAS